VNKLIGIREISNAIFLQIEGDGVDWFGELRKCLRKPDFIIFEIKSFKVIE
jgi:hypothetical protein